MRTASRLSLEQFQTALQSNVAEGNPWIKGTPLALFTFFDSKAKYFYGEHSDHDFILTRNAGMFNLTEFVVEGQYLPVHGEPGVIVDYVVKPIPFDYWWVRLMPPIALTVVSAMLLVTVGANALTAVVIIWLWLGIPWLAMLRRSNKLKKRLEESFREYFDIV